MPCFRATPALPHAHAPVTEARRVSTPRRVLASLALAAALLAHAPARAQGGGATVDVQVTDAEKGAPLAGATVHLDGVPRAVSDSTGRIVLHGLGPGRHLLAVVMVGRRAVTPEIEIAGGEVLTLEVMLEPEPVKVPGVQGTSARGGTAQEHAMRRGGGHYLGRAEIAKSGARRLSELLIRIGALQPNGRLRMARCAPKLVADGVMITNADIDIFPIQDLEAVEVYSIGAVPPEFGGSLAGDCGIVAVWTRHD